MKALILVGGSGTRLWPLSRNGFPKQFLALGEGKSLLQRTVDRCLHFVKPKDLVFLTNKEYQFHIKNQLKDMDTDLCNHIILEPVGRNTAPAIALGAKYVQDQIGAAEDEVLFIGPSDHIIAPEGAFAETVKRAEKLAKAGYIVTFGVIPNKPETGYGYIKKGQPLETQPGNELPGTPGAAARVEKFVEKPDLKRAQEYVLSGNYLFNSGMFVFSLKTLMEELQQHAPAIPMLLNGTFAESLKVFDQMPGISIDYAVMEKSKRVIVLPLEVTWSDVGSWDSVYEDMSKDERGNVMIGDIIDINTRNCLIMGQDRLIATIGLEDLMIIETADALLISKRQEGQQVKEIVQRLKSSENHRQLTEIHTTVYRPWGSYTVLEVGPRHKLKRIVVQPGEKLSLQMHYHRSEHWVVIKGTARIVVGDSEEHFVHENESIFVPKTAKHRLQNPGKVPLEIIEVQVGEYVGEDDIERYDDIYNRA